MKTIELNALAQKAKGKGLRSLLINNLHGKADYGLDCGNENGRFAFEVWEGDDDFLAIIDELDIILAQPSAGFFIRIWDLVELGPPLSR